MTGAPHRRARSHAGFNSRTGTRGRTRGAGAETWGGIQGPDPQIISTHTNSTHRHTGTQAHTHTHTHTHTNHQSIEVPLNFSKKIQVVCCPPPGFVLTPTREPWIRLGSPGVDPILTPGLTRVIQSSQNSARLSRRNVSVTGSVWLIRDRYTAGADSQGASCLQMGQSSSLLLLLSDVRVCLCVRVCCVCCLYVCLYLCL